MNKRCFSLRNSKLILRDAVKRGNLTDLKTSSNQQQYPMASRSADKTIALKTKTKWINGAFHYATVDSPRCCETSKYHCSQNFAKSAPLSSVALRSVDKALALKMKTTWINWAFHYATVDLPGCHETSNILTILKTSLIQPHCPMVSHSVDKAKIKWINGAFHYNSWSSGMPWNEQQSYTVLKSSLKSPLWNGAMVKFW